MPGCIYSLRPVDKTSLSPFFVASIRSQSSRAIPEIGSCPRVHVCEGNLAGIICRDYLHFIAIPLNEILMHCGRDTAVGVDPIPPKQYRICTLAVDDEERSRDRLAANCQLHVKNSHCF